MRRIEKLTEDIHSSMRSGVVIFDFARVVEELVFNSLEAGATKVSVGVGIGSSYVKVSDNGYGITRDELVLLGERYATSKVDHMAAMDIDPECFDFHGEALCSISHVSLLEIVTKARGKPNGYKKIMKNCKCLFLGINDDMQDVGTTVTARDIFYNQPVRRKHLESSPQKVLDSIKMSVLRIALVHVNVSFKVVDVESTCDLLYTRPSPSPLPILFNNFGVDKSVDFHELDLSDGLMKLSGYISGPREIFSLKAIQYAYINSRFICKGPIHKVLNQLAAKFDLTNSWKPTTSSQSDKQNRSHICPTFILNLKCPRSYYDIVTSERSRTAVEFKDWNPVLAFIENGIKHLWMKNLSHGVPVASESGIKRLRKQNCQTSLDLCSPQINKLPKNYEHIPAWEECSSPLGIPPTISHVEKHHNEARFLSDTDYISQSRHASLDNYTVLTASTKDSNNLYSSNVFSPKRCQFIPHTSYNPTTSESGRKKRMKQNCQTSPDFSSPHVEKPSKNYEHSPAWEDCLSPLGILPTIPSFKKHQNQAVLLSATDNIIQSRDGILDGYRVTKHTQSSSHLSPRAVFSPEHYQFIPHNLDGYRVTKHTQSSSHLSPRAVFSPEHYQFIPHRSGKQEVGNFLKFDDNISMRDEISADFLGFGDIRVNHEQKRTFLRSCSNQRKLRDKIPAANDERFEFGSSDFLRVNHDDNYVDEVEHFFSGRELQSDESPQLRFSPDIQDAMAERSDFLMENSVKSPLGFRNILSNSEYGRKCNSSERYLSSGWSPPPKEQNFTIRFHEDNVIDENLVEDDPEFGKDTTYGHSPCREDADTIDSNLFTKEDWQLQNCSFMKFSLYPKDHTYRKRGIDEFHCGDFENSISGFPSRRPNETDWSHLPYYAEESPQSYSVPALHNTTSKEHRCGRDNWKGMICNRNKSTVRSHSAPPFHKSKRRFTNLSDSATTLSAKSTTQINNRPLSCAEPSNLNHTQLHAETGNLKRSFDQFQLSCKDLFAKSPNIRKTSEVMMVQNGRPPKDRLINIESVECLDSKKIQNSFDPGEKWRDYCSPTAGGNAPCYNKDQDSILDIASGILYLSGDSAPRSIDKTSLDLAKVLSQVDKKFIAVVAGRTLAVIDQHAADERIRLEELRDKVLSGEMKTITYLDSERELILPEVGYQLLHNYSEQIQAWGWILNTHSHETSSFTKNLNFLHRHPTVVKLVAVPCILGVNLTDIDLLEFLQQLADTDGSSTIPPSVRYILNSKACRGAIMFGDILLPSECSLIVEELKQTSLCFQCAHGRPTTVPLVNLDILQNNIAKLRSDKPWHGLHQHELSLHRCAQRLSSAIC